MSSSFAECPPLPNAYVSEHHRFLARLRRCAGSPEPLFIAYNITTLFSSRGSRYRTCSIAHIDPIPYLFGKTISSWIHAYMILTPLKPLWYGKTGVNRGIHYFLIFAQNIDCVYSLEPPRRGGSNEYLQSMFWAEIWKISEFFIWKFSVFGREILYISE